MLRDGLKFVSLPDNVELPLRVWLLRIGVPANKVMPFFDEKQVKEVAAQLENEARHGTVTVIGPYDFED